MPYWLICIYFLFSYPETMKNILCFGDSNTYGYNPENCGRYDNNTRWTGVLQELLKDEYNIIEEGYNARTVIFKDYGDYKTCSIDYLPDCLQKYSQADLVIIMLGLNDFQTIFHASVDAVLTGIKTLINIIRGSEYHSDTEILLLPPAIIGNNIDRSNFGCMFNKRSIAKTIEFSKKLKTLAKDEDCEYFDVNRIIKTCSEDSIHFNMNAHRKIAETLSVLIPQII